MTDDLRIQIQEQARQAQFWKDEARKWQRLWERAANRLMAVDPEFNQTAFITTADRVRKLGEVLGDTAWNPWEDI